jgi:hypothetical protein
MKTNFREYPTDWHKEVNEDGEELKHPGYTEYFCRYCEQPYLGAKGSPQSYDCGDRQLHGHINRDIK